MCKGEKKRGSGIKFEYLHYLCTPIYRKRMIIEYCNSKEVKCYRDFVQNPSDRKALRAFSKTFGDALMEPAKKLHDRLIQYASAGTYNSIYGNTDNRIELKQGCADKNPLIFKVRVGRGPRKFFYHELEDGSHLLKKNWTGDFDSITKVYVIAINNHDYNVQ